MPIVDSQPVPQRGVAVKTAETAVYLRVYACNGSDSSEHGAIDGPGAPPYIRDTLSTIDEVGAPCSVPPGPRALPPRAQHGAPTKRVRTWASPWSRSPSAAAGCSSGGEFRHLAGLGRGTSTLVIANAVRVDTLDPAANSVNESIWMDQNLYSRLLQPNPNGTGLLPDLAT